LYIMYFAFSYPSHLEQSIYEAFSRLLGTFDI
jgi:hypothetical protein